MEQTDNLNHKSIRLEVEVKTEITIKETIRIGTDPITGQIGETEDSTDETEVGLGMNRILGEVILGETLEIMVDKTVEESTDETEVGLGMNRILGEVILGETLEIMVDKTVEESTETAIEMTVMTQTGTGPELMAII